MFTGIVEELGEIASLRLADDSSHAQVVVRGPKVTADVGRGDSIAVSGVCLTVVDFGDGCFTTDLMRESLDTTAARRWCAGTPVNLERSVTPATRLGGHIVQGHVDGVGRLVARSEKDGYDELTVALRPELGRYVAAKGAIAVDGISLTVIDVTDGGEGCTFTLGIIPETRTVTTMGIRQPGDEVNIEVDVMAKYVARLLTTRVGDSGQDSQAISEGAAS